MGDVTGTREQMLRALQVDVHAWPERVRAAGVVTRSGAPYTPLARNNAVRRTPDDPEATLAYMLEVWSGPDAERGSDGWYRIISQAGPELTWEWLMVDEDRPYAPLFDSVRERVKRALEDDSGTAEWRECRERQAREAAARRRRVEQMREEMRAGRRGRSSQSSTGTAERPPSRDGKRYGRGRGEAPPWPSGMPMSVEGVFISLGGLGRGAMTSV